MKEGMLRVTLGDNIKKYRAKRNWSQADLSEKTGLSIVYISDIERGNKWPYVDTLVKLSEAFDIEAFELLKPNDNIPENTTKILTKYQDETLAIIEKSIETMRKSVKKSIQNLREQYT
ncbi:MAG: helix-turn-helix domain-containing protein [Treponema sp.]|nr:helix-turn-helix domain-containing protein [Treponema sp.]